MLTDRFGGRIVFSAVMLLTIVPAFLMGTVNDYAHLLAYGFLIGVGHASVSVGVGFVSGWYFGLIERRTTDSTNKRRK